MRPFYVDYGPAPDCSNPETYGAVCAKCGQCGRRFDEQGLLRKEVRQRRIPGQRRGRQRAASVDVTSRE